MALLALNHLGRRASQALFLVLLGSSILAVTFVPLGEGRERGAQGQDGSHRPLFLGDHSRLSEARRKEKLGANAPRNQSEDLGQTLPLSGWERAKGQEKSVQVDGCLHRT